MIVLISSRTFRICSYLPWAGKWFQRDPAIILFFTNKKIQFIWAESFLHCTKNEVFHYGFLEYMWPNPHFPMDLVRFTKEIRNGKLNFLCSKRDLAYCWLRSISSGEIFSHMNAFSWLREIIFSYEPGAKKYYIIILYTIIMIL